MLGLNMFDEYKNFTREQKDAFRFLSLWIVLHLIDKYKELQEEGTAEQTLCSKFNNKLKCIKEEETIVGASFGKEDIKDLLIEDNIPQEIVSRVVNLPVFESGARFELVWEKDEGIVGVVHEKLIDAMEVMDKWQIIDKQTTIKLIVDQNYISSLELSREDQVYLIWHRAFQLFFGIDADVSTGGFGQHLRTMTGLRIMLWVEIILDLFQIKAKRIFPSAAIALVDWLTYNKTKVPTVVLDSLDLMVFLLVAIIRVGRDRVYSNIKEYKENLVFHLILKIIRQFGKLNSVQWGVGLVSAIDLAQPIIGQEAGLLDFDSGRHKKNPRSRTVLIYADPIGRLFKSEDGVENLLQKIEGLVSARTVLTVPGASNSLNWNIALYDQDCFVNKIGYSDFSKFDDFVIDKQKKCLDFSLAGSNSFLNAVKSFLWTEYLIDRATFASMKTYPAKANEIVRANGIAFIEEASFRSGEVVSLGGLDDYMTVTRGQMLKTCSEENLAYEVNPGDIEESGLIAQPKKFVINLDKDANERYKIRKGDVLIGVKGLVGVVGFIDREVKNWYAGQAIAILRMRKEDETNGMFLNSICPEFVFLSLKNQKTQIYVKRVCMSEKSKSLDMGKLRNIKLPLPEMTMKAYQSKCKKLFDSWKKFQELKDSINSMAFFDNLLGVHALLSLKVKNQNKIADE